MSSNRYFIISTLTTQPRLPGIPRTGPTSVSLWVVLSPNYVTPSDLTCENGLKGTPDRRKTLGTEGIKVIIGMSLSSGRQRTVVFEDFV